MESRGRKKLERQNRVRFEESQVNSIRESRDNDEKPGIAFSRGRRSKFHWEKGRDTRLTIRQLAGNMENVAENLVEERVRKDAEY